MMLELYGQSVIAAFLFHVMFMIYGMVAVRHVPGPLWLIGILAFRCWRAAIWPLDVVRTYWMMERLRAQVQILKSIPRR